MLRLVLLAVAAATILGLMVPQAFAVTDPCPRPPAGAIVAPPPDLYSASGHLDVILEYHTTVDDEDRTLFCFTTPDGLESPTLHVNPGDKLNITLKNMVPALPAGAPNLAMAIASDTWCGSPTMTATSVNMHFHGTNTSPTCHSDEVIKTLVNSGQTFKYSLTFPDDEPAGLYWYHPHVHGIAEAAVQGGATGLIEVEGIEKVQPAVAGLPERFLVIRDQLVEVPPVNGQTQPSWDLTLNYVPIAYPKYVPSVIEVPPGRKEFWRVANTSADTIVDLQLDYDGVIQSLEVAALDGVATGSQDGTGRGTLVRQTHLLIPPAGRAEFIATTPSSSVHQAIFRTLAIDTGPTGDSDTARPLATLKVVDPKSHLAGATNLPIAPAPSGPPGPQRFAGIDAAPVTINRGLYFLEFNFIPGSPKTRASAPPPDATSVFYITVDGQNPEAFNPNNPPAIITRQGSVEEWTIENRTWEVHEFHMHQIHFQLRAINGIPVAPADRQFRDTVQVPYWTGVGPYPSVTLAMDFRGPVVGDFVYHCHILGHEG